MINPFVVKAKLKELEEAGFVEGAKVRVWWEVDAAYTSEPGKKFNHTGIVKEFGKFMHIEPTERTPGHLRIGCTSITDYEVLEPPAAAAPPRPKDNPFVKAAMKRAQDRQDAVAAKRANPALGPPSRRRRIPGQS